MIKNKAIIYIHKDKFEYYDEIQNKIFQFIFQPNLIQDLEIVDPDQLNLQLKNFISANKLTPASILIMVSDVIIFEKIFPVLPGTDKNSEIQKFLDTIPFEHVIYKVTDHPKDYKVLALNKDLYEAVRRSFEALGSTIHGIIAQSSLGDAFRTAQSLNSEMPKYILTHFDALQKEAFAQEEINIPEQSDNETGALVQHPQQSMVAKNPMDKYRLPVLLSVFVLLFGIMGYLLYSRYTVKSKASPVPSTIVAPEIETPTSTPQENQISTPSASPT